MRNGSWPNADVVATSGELEINGAIVSASDMSIARSIPSSLPEQVAGVGGYSLARGTATLLPTLPVSETVRSPWGPAFPRPFDKVSARTICDGQSLDVFTGIVDEVSGAASDDTAKVSFIDSYDRLSQAVTMRPMCKVMPSPTTNGTTNPLNSDLFSTYFVDKALRECGFYATPPRIGYCVMSAPMMGSAWPEIGRLTWAARGASWKESPYWATVPWGVAAGVLRADYAPDFDRWASIDGRFIRPMEIVLCAGTNQSASGRIYAEWPSGARLSVAVTSARSVIVQVMFPSTLGEWQTVLTATAATLGGWRNVTVRFSPIGNGKMKVELRTNNRGVASVSGPSIPYGPATQVMSNIRVDLAQNALGGFQVGFPSNSVAFAAAEHKPTAVLTPPVPFEPMTGSPTIPPTPAIDLLKQWAEQECAAMWIDEDGVFQWRNRTRFVAGTHVWEGDSVNSLMDLQWSHDAQSASRAATVNYKTVGVKRSNRSRVTVWQGSGQTMEPGDVMEDFVQEDANEAWINVDSSVGTYVGGQKSQMLNNGEGSWLGFTAYDVNGDVAGNGANTGYTAAVEHIGTNMWKIRHAWDGWVPAGVDHIKLETISDDPSVKPQWQGAALPILRAQSVLSFADASMSATAGGPAEAASLEHDVGWWVQTETAVRSLAYWLAQQTSRPLPVVSGVEIVPDPRLQLGDKIRVTDTHRTGIRVTGVITSIDYDIAAGDTSMRLRLVVTEVFASKPTLYEYDQVWGGAALSSRDELWAGQSLAAFDADPLKR